MKYIRISSIKYRAGTYDNCYAGICVREDRQKYKIYYDEVVWKDNTGHLVRRRYYVPREIGRRILKAYRCARAMMLSTDIIRGYTPLQILKNGLLSNFSDAEPHIIRKYLKIF